MRVYSVMLSQEARRSAVYIGGGVLLVAWLAAANSTTRQVPPLPEPPPRAAAAPDAIALEVQAEAQRLRARLQDAPSPAIGERNPFSFAPSPAARTSAAAVAPRAMGAAAPLALPALMPLTLMGIAEEPSPEGLHRTAIVGGAADAIYMVMEGQAFANRYRVTRIGADAIELQDLLSGGYRRLTLNNR